ncbi:DUF1320 domain-containing protein [uncultured Cohaesibacter sp.]|uniref:DUF1320 domain-containing protein n=1 Tax=uncultured Cohaesibacter sp. TaxID=1002546 RepID=UPI002AABF4AC|nr:DUF1320 domain-containing protein [uncultured Cohaesibacter sp.]
MYASADDWLSLEAAHKDLADTDYDGEPNSTDINMALSRASAEMDGWLNKRYGVPIEDEKAVDLLKHHCCAIATYHIANTANTASEGIENRYKDSIAWLKSVSKGDADVPMTSAISSGVSTGVGVTFVSPDRIFK